MKKSELAKVLAAKAEISAKKATEVIEHFVDAINQQVWAAGSVTVAGLGTWSVKTYAPRQCRNPATGETMSLGERKRIKFKVSKALKTRPKGAKARPVKIPAARVYNKKGTPAVQGLPPGPVEAAGQTQP